MSLKLLFSISRSEIFCRMNKIVFALSMCLLHVGKSFGSFLLSLHALITYDDF